MQKKIVVCALALVLVLLPLGGAARAQQPSNVPDKAAKAKAEVTKRVMREKTRVKIRLRGGGEVKGRISQAGEDSFTVTNEKTGRQTEVAYGEVEKVKGRGWSKGAKIGIFAAVGAVAVAAVLAITIARVSLDPWPR